MPVSTLTAAPCRAAAFPAVNLRIIAEGTAAQQLKLTVLAIRVCALPLGRGALTLGTLRPLPTEPLHIPPLCLGQGCRNFQGTPLCCTWAFVAVPPAMRVEQVSASAPCVQLGACPSRTTQL